MNPIDPNVEAVREKLRQRAEIGLRKYGVTTERTDLSEEDWELHLQEELLDAAVYLEAKMAKRRRAKEYQRPQERPTPQDREAYEKWAKGQQRQYASPPASVTAHQESSAKEARRP